MLRATHHALLRYPTGLRFTSRQSRHFGGHTLNEEISVGNEFEYKESLEKYIVFETYGKVEIKHVFLKSSNTTKLYPIYSRVLGTEEEYPQAYVGLYRQSIQELLSFLRGENIRLSSTNDLLLKKMAASLTSLESWPAVDLLQDFQQNEYNNNLVNDGVVLLPSTTPSIVDDASTQMDGFPYLSRTLSTFNTEERAEKWMDYVVSFILDLVNCPNDVFRYTYSHPIWTEVETIFNPFLGDQYEAIKFDPVTSLNMHDVEVDPRKLYAVMCAGKPTGYQHSTYGSNHVEVKYPVVFNSNFLLWLTTLHQLPFRQIAFTYILPTRQRPFEFKNIHGTALNQVDLHSLLMRLVDVTLLWKSSIDRVDVCLTANDELWMTIHEQGTSQTWFVDMVVPLMLSQKFYS